MLPEEEQAARDARIRATVYPPRIPVYKDVLASNEEIAMARARGKDVWVPAQSREVYIPWNGTLGYERNTPLNPLTPMPGHAVRRVYTGRVRTNAAERKAQEAHAQTLPPDMRKIVS